MPLIVIVMVLLFDLTSRLLLLLLLLALVFLFTRLLLHCDIDEGTDGCIIQAEKWLQRLHHSFHTRSRLWSVAQALVCEPGHSLSAFHGVKPIEARVHDTPKLLCIGEVRPCPINQVLLSVRSVLVDAPLPCQ